MDYYSQKESICLKQPCGFQMGQCIFTGDKLKEKPVISSCRKDVRSFEYSSLFSSKTYSILSYIVGGFVGSKSQMNNNKHNLSYDLSAAIFNLLKPYKYEKDRSSMKKSNEIDFFGTTPKINLGFYDKYIISKSSQKDDKLSENYGFTELGWLNSLPLEEFVHQENYLLAPNEQTFVEKREEKNCGKFSQPASCDNSKEIMNGIDKRQSMFLKSDFKTKPILIENTKLKEHGLLESDVGADKIYTSVDSTDSSVSQITKIDNSVTDSFCHKDPRETPTHSVNFLATKRFRQYSECSVESTDSESFIVFDCQEDDGLRDEECWCIDVDNVEVDSDDGIDDGDGSCDEYDACSMDKEIKEANERWSKNYEDVILDEVETERKVKFNDDVKINKIVAWDFAYRAARLGPWEQMARDRARFQERILRLSLTISPILKKEHRDKISEKLNKYFSDKNNPT